MKKYTLIGTAGVVAALAMSNMVANAQGPGRGRGMPEEARNAIHGLFEAHAKFHREVKKTEKGYLSKTTSKDPAAVKLLQTHVKQMENRLKQGMMVRRWDPAYEEFVRYYDEIEIKITNIENGISITAVGKTAEARKVARNHAGIISKFIKNGWSEHDKRHPAAIGKEAEAAGPDAAGKCECRNEEKAKGKGACPKCEEEAAKKKCCPAAGAAQKPKESQKAKAVKLGATNPIHAVGDVYLAGQPRPDDFKLAKGQGIQTVINLRHEREIKDFNEKSVVEAAGLNYVALPWNGADELTDEVVKRVRDLFTTAERPLLMHCGSSNRVGAVWLPWRVLDDGVDLEKAVAEAKEIGLKSAEYEKKARDYISRNRKEN